MAVCFLMVLYIHNELGYDQYQERGDRIYRLAMERKYPGRSAFRGGIPQSIGEAVKKEFPEVLESTRIMRFESNITVGDKSFTEKETAFADANFFRVFTGEFLQGNGNTALQKPGTVVLNETTAKKYFGSTNDAMGKEIKLGYRSYMISGVFRDWPEKSHIQFNILMTTSGLEGLDRLEYIYFGPYTYLLLNKENSAAALEAKLPLIVDKYVSGVVERLFGEPYKQFLAEGNGYRYFLQPVKKIHLESELEDEWKPVSSMRIIIVFGAIAGFILFLACVNFINLSTAVSVERAREVGIRKTFGSRKPQLIGQFISESTMFSLISMLFAVALTWLVIPLMNSISGGTLSFAYFLDPLKILALLGFALCIGIIAGLYPAFVLSGFDPIMVLKGRFKSNRRGLLLRNGLVIFQFSISVILIICTIVVNRQMQFMLGDRLGFKKDHIITIEGLGVLRNSRQGNSITDQRQAFVDDLAKIPGVQLASECSSLPGNDDTGGGATWIALDNQASRTQRVMQVDDKYIDLLGLQMKEGRFFSRDYKTDSLSVVLNEQAAADFGLKHPIGARLISKEKSGLATQDGRGQLVYTCCRSSKRLSFSIAAHKHSHH